MTHEKSTAYADIFLLAHKSGVALWEVWLPAPDQALDPTRWIAWLDPESDGGLVAQLWRTLAPAPAAVGSICTAAKAARRIMCQLSRRRAALFRLL